MPAAYRNANTATCTGASSSLTFTTPSGTAIGDVLVVYIYSTSGVTQPGGWTLISSGAVMDGSFYVYTKEITSTPAGSYAWTVSTYTTSVGAIVCVQTPASVSPVGNYSHSTSTTSPAVAPSIAPATSNDLLLCGFFSGSTINTPTGTTPSGMTKRATNTVQDTNTYRVVLLEVNTEALTSSAATGTRSSTITDYEQNSVGHSLIIKSQLGNAGLFFGSNF